MLFKDIMKVGVKDSQDAKRPVTLLSITTPITADNLNADID